MREEKFEQTTTTKQTWYGWNLVDSDYFEFDLNLHTGKMIVSYDGGFCGDVKIEDVKKLYERLKMHFEPDDYSVEYLATIAKYKQLPRYVGPKIRREGTTTYIEEESKVVYDE